MYQLQHSINEDCIANVLMQSTLCKNGNTIINRLNIYMNHDDQNESIGKTKFNVREKVCTWSFHPHVQT